MGRWSMYNQIRSLTKSAMVLYSYYYIQLETSCLFMYVFPIFTNHDRPPPRVTWHDPIPSAIWPCGPPQALRYLGAASQKSFSEAFVVQLHTSAGAPVPYLCPAQGTAAPRRARAPDADAEPRPGPGFFSKPMKHGIRICSSQVRHLFSARLPYPH